MTAKKFTIVVFVFLCFFVLAGCALKSSNGSPTTAPEPSVVPTKPIEESIKERPFLSLVPTADGHWVDLAIKKIPKSTTSLEYELTYFADVEGNKIERGVTSGKPVDLAGLNEFSKKVLFGSASCTTGTCKYKYDENVTEGTVVLKLNRPSGVEKYESVFRIQKGKEAKDGLTTGDGVFSFVSTALPANNLYLTISTIGLSSALPEGKVAKSVPYSIFPSVNIKGKISFKSAEQGVVVMLFDGAKWQELPTVVSGGVASAETQKSGIFILVK